MIKIRIGINALLKGIGNGRGKCLYLPVLDYSTKKNECDKSELSFRPLRCTRRICHRQNNNALIKSLRFHPVWRYEGYGFLCRMCIRYNDYLSKVDFKKWNKYPGREIRNFRNVCQLNYVDTLVGLCGSIVILSLYNNIRNSGILLIAVFLISPSLKFCRTVVKKGKRPEILGMSSIHSLLFVCTPYDYCSL
ncbi:hypothetical protein AGLY_004289 [Aphis glycines]|uniref:Uncharacterized protein n=1 Tax=Aphis glycines TaxID=307491 RepID=A0A6G0TY58_APHGL|nr:hypothetical protein AGLY_004289 [Aphis glycines]